MELPTFISVMALALATILTQIALIRAMRRIDRLEKQALDMATIFKRYVGTQKTINEMFMNEIVGK